MSARVFISYAREDQEFVRRLASELRTRGISIWLDQWDILPGADWNESIDKALHESERFIVILSPAAVASRQVRAEIQAAVDTAKAVFPVLYKDCAVPRVIRLYQLLDFRDDHKYSQTERLVEALSGQREPAPPSYLPSTRSKIWRTRRLTMATAAVALVGGLLLFIFSPFSEQIHIWISNSFLREVVGLHQADNLPSSSNIGPAFAIASYHEFGWASGAANNNDQRSARFFKITAVEPTPDGLNVFYDWKDGVLQLHPVANQLMGNWRQSNGSGLVELSFDRNGRFVQGRWNDGGDSQWYPAFLR